MQAPKRNCLTERLFIIIYSICDDCIRTAQMNYQSITYQQSEFFLGQSQLFKHEKTLSIL